MGRGGDWELEPEDSDHQLELEKDRAGEYDVDSDWVDTEGHGQSGTVGVEDTVEGGRLPYSGPGSIRNDLHFQLTHF